MGDRHGRGWANYEHAFRDLATSQRRLVLPQRYDRVTSAKALSYVSLPFLFSACTKGGGVPAFTDDERASPHSVTVDALTWRLLRGLLLLPPAQLHACRLLPRKLLVPLACLAAAFVVLSASFPNSRADSLSGRGA